MRFLWFSHQISKHFVKKNCKTKNIKKTLKLFYTPLYAVLCSPNPRWEFQKTSVTFNMFAWFFCNDWQIGWLAGRLAGWPSKRPWTRHAMKPPSFAYSTAFAEHFPPLQTTAVQCLHSICLPKMSMNFSFSLRQLLVFNVYK